MKHSTPQNNMKRPATTLQPSDCVWEKVTFAISSGVWEVGFEEKGGGGGGM